MRNSVTINIGHFLIQKPNLKWPCSSKLQTYRRTSENMPTNSFLGFHPLKSLERCISAAGKTSRRLWFETVSSWEGFFQQEAHQYSSRCGWIRCQNTALFFSLSLQLWSQLSFQYPQRWTANPSRLTSLTETRGLNPARHAVGITCRISISGRPLFVNAPLLEQIGSALGCEIKLMA